MWPNAGGVKPRASYTNSYTAHNRHNRGSGERHIETHTGHITSKAKAKESKTTCCCHTVGWLNAVQNGIFWSDRD